MTDPRLPQIIALRRSGASWDEVGERLALSREGARKILLRGGIPDPMLEYRAERDAEERANLERRRAERQARVAARINAFLGQRFGTLVVLEVRGSYAHGEALVQCDCGVRSVVRVRNLASGATQSCGSKIHHLRGWSPATAPINVIYIPGHRDNNPW